MRRPRGFNRDEFRSRFALDNCDIVLLFSALGHFERKGLPLILAALRELENPKLKLLVVGGQMDVIARYISIVTGMGLQNQVIFVGMQRDVRPFLWAADAFMLPSFYEAFPLVSLEAAAAGVPAIVTHLHGVEELIEDGRNGIFIEPTVPSVCAGIRRFLKFQQTDWQKMGHQAAVDVGRFDTSHFLDRWRQFLQVTYA